MPNCAVANCNTYNRKTKGTNVSYYQFPKLGKIQKIWVNACNRKDTFNVKYARICSKHFNDCAYKRNLKAELMGIQAKKVLKECAVPTENLPKTVHITETATKRDAQAAKRSRKQIVKELINQKNLDQDEILPSHKTDDTIIILDTSNITECNDINILKEEIRHLRQQNELFLKEKEDLLEKIKLLTSEKSLNK